MSALHQENIFTSYAFGKNRLYFAIAKALDINFSRLTSISFTDEPR
jgi:hypothetical protein